MYQRDGALHQEPLAALLARQAAPRPRRLPLRGRGPTADPGALAELSRAAHREVAPPYVFVDRRPVGGMGKVRALVGSGQFERLSRGNL